MTMNANIIIHKNATKISRIYLVYDDIEILNPCIIYIGK
jgi:hypothetical protein